jgi:LysR family hydrogen peroxide-inducible transcriptional activator
MKIQHLRFFVSTVDCGGIVKAAERLRVSQPAVSAGLKALEQELGKPLFERKGPRRSTRPTAKAVEFHKEAVEILRKCEAARAQFRRKETQAPKLRIGVLKTISSRQIASFSRALAGEYPEMQLRIREGGPIRLQEWLRGGQIDAAWTVVDEVRRNMCLLWRDKFVMLVGQSHRFARTRRGGFSWSDLEGENFILRGACEAPRGQLWPESLRMKVIARAERDELAMKLVAEGLGIAIAPESLVIDGVFAQPVRGLDATRSIGLRWRADLGSDMLDAAMKGLKLAT